MKKNFCCLLFSLFYFYSPAQYGTLKGIVLDEKTKQPLTGANIFDADQLSTKAATDVEGRYELKLSEGIHPLVCSFIGMETDTFKVHIENEKTYEYNVLLKEKFKELNTIIVSAGKYEQKLEEITVSMEVIKPELIQQKNTVKISSVLEQVPGITILDEEPQIRGGSGFTFGVGSRVSTLIDGIPILSGDVGRTDWAFIPTENIEQVEIIKGASSVLYGSAALSGVINVLTTYPKNEPTTNVQLYSGLYDSPKNKNAKWWDGPAHFSGINFVHAHRLGQFDLVIGGMAKYDHNFIGPAQKAPSIFIAADSISNEEVAARAGRMNFSFRYRSKKITGLSAGINGNFMLSHDNFSLIWLNDTDGIYKAFPKTITITDATQFYLDPYISYFSKDGLKQDLRTRFFYQDNKNTNDQSNRSRVYYGEYKINKTFLESEGLNFTAGIVMNQTYSHAELFAYSGKPDNKLKNYAVYTQLDKKLLNVLNASVGFRGEYFQINNTEITFKPIFRAGLNLQLARATYLRYSYGQGYRYPTIAEKFIQTSTGGINLFPNPGLQPENSWNTEVGIKQGYKIGNFYGFLDIAAFWQEYFNTIEYNYAIWGVDSVGFKFVNTGETRIRGIDVSWMGEGKLGKNFKLSLLAGYSYVLPQSVNPEFVYAIENAGLGFIPKQLSYNSTSTDTINNILKYRFQTSAKIDMQLTYKKAFIGYSIRYYSYMQNIDKTFYDLDKPYLLPTGIVNYRMKNHTGITVFDIRSGYSFAKFFTASVIVNNLFNLEYSLRPLKIESPRTFILQLSYKMG